MTGRILTVKPEFICIGAQKAGTTWLFSRLDSHPEFSMLPIKELHYFDRAPSYRSPNTLATTNLSHRLMSPGYCVRAAKHIGREMTRGDLGRARWWKRYFLSDYNDKWYRSLFADQPGITGDITPSYSMLRPEEVARLHSMIPSGKLVFMIRNPIERAWSQYRFDERLGQEIDLADFEGFRQFVDSPGQELRSNYLRTIDSYLRYFHAEQMLIGYFDAILEQPRALLAAILKHIGATDFSSCTNLKQISNKSRPLEMPAQYRDYLTQKYFRDIEELARRYGGYATSWLALASGEQQYIKKQDDPIAPVAFPIAK